MIKVGITGGIGAGKTIVAQILKALGYPVYPADREAKRLMTESPEIKKAVIALLGENAFEGSQLNRPFIAQSLFGNNILLKKINALVHPAVKSDFLWWVATFPSSSLLFIESALIYQANLQNELNTIVSITAPLPLRIERIMKRDGITERAALNRIAAQKEEEEKALNAGVTICNDNQTALIPQVQSLLDMMRH